ncbi:MAG: hypothetical protein K6F07_01340, partial [Bacilli bacterium]|nr:hypothetical protein [Bacilli bacterium]
GYSLFNHYKKVINIRNKYPFLKQGVLTSLCSSLGKYQSGLFAYRISLGDQYINVIHNFSSESRKCNAIGNKIVDEINTSKKSPSIKNGTMTIAPYSSIITQ